MELPVVSSRSGAIPELVEDDVNGILVLPGDGHGGDPAVGGRPRATTSLRRGGSPKGGGAFRPELERAGVSGSFSILKDSDVVRQLRRGPRS